MTKNFGFHIWSILSLVAYFLEKNSPFFEKIERIRQIFCLCLLEAQQADPLFSAEMCRLCIYHQAMTKSIQFVKAKNLTDHTKKHFKSRLPSTTYT
jgi:hypothetical protein